jgi:hypothetical protein
VTEPSPPQVSLPQISLPQKVVDVHRALDAVGIAHAFGGALALAYYGEPRTTHDIDLNVFVTAARARRALEALASIGVDTDLDAAKQAAMRRDEQVRVSWGRTPLDLFFSSVPLHREMAKAAGTVPFGPTTIPILSAEHLVVCKVAFDRRKDWLDIEQVLLVCEPLDTVEIARWLDELLGHDDRRSRRFRGLAAEFGR